MVGVDLGQAAKRSRAVVSVKLWERWGFQAM